MKRMSLYVWVISLLSIGLLSCRQELPLPQDGEVAFWVSADLDGQAERWEAGKDGLIMKPSHSRDGDIRVFSGAFGPMQQVDRLEIHFRDQDFSQENDPFDWRQVLTERAYHYRTQKEDPDRLTVRFRANLQGTAPVSYLWDFGDGNTSTEPSPTHTYASPGSYMVTLETTTDDGCISTSRQMVVANPRDTNCGARIRVSQIDENQFKMWVVYPDPAIRPPTLFWSTGDGEHYLNEDTILHTYDEVKIYEVKLIANFGKNTTCYDFLQLYSGTGPNCVTSIDYSFHPLGAALGEVWMVYRTADGKVYSTDAFEGQAEESTFQILDIEPYQAAPDGTATLKVNFSFAANLHALTDDREKLSLTSGTGTIAIGIPEN